MTDNTRSGERVRQLREHKGWSQQRLATEAGLSISTVARWEGGSPPVKYAVLGAVARTLGVTVHELMGEGAA